MENIFEQASRLALRFDSPKGKLTVEDLWGIPLTSNNPDKANLDAIAVGLYAKLKDDEGAVSFVNDTPPAALRETQLKFSIAKYIIDVRKTENKAAADAEKRRADKQRILEIIERKEHGELEGKSLDELRALAAGM